MGSVYHGSRWQIASDQRSQPITDTSIERAPAERAAFRCLIATRSRDFGFSDFEFVRHSDYLLACMHAVRQHGSEDEEDLCLSSASLHRHFGPEEAAFRARPPLPCTHPSDPVPPLIGQAPPPSNQDQNRTPTLKLTCTSVKIGTIWQNGDPTCKQCTFCPF